MLVYLQNPLIKENKMIIKNLFDRFGSLCLLTILSPLFIVIALLIKLDSKGDIFFIQERIGLNGLPFQIYKFRTMIPNAINIGLGVHTNENDPRITRMGHFLRKTSLDELPQLINILKGEMSFIGPRPTLAYQVEAYDDFQRKRLLMKPGVTGLAQINGRNSISWPKRIEFDVEYVENWSIMLDIKIFLKTFFVIFNKNDIYGDHNDH